MGRVGKWWPSLVIQPLLRASLSRAPPFPTLYPCNTCTGWLSRHWLFKGGWEARTEYQRPHSCSVPLGLAQMLLAPNLRHRTYVQVQISPNPQRLCQGVSLHVVLYWHLLPSVRASMAALGRSPNSRLSIKHFLTHTWNFRKVKNKFVGILCSDMQQGTRKRAIANGNLLKLKKWLSFVTPMIKV